MLFYGTERNFWEVVDFINNETLYTLSEQDTIEY